MVEDPQYRPATRRDFRDAITGVDARTLSADEVAARRVEETRVVEERAAVEDPRPFSIAAGFFGWAVASFFTLVLSTIVLALIGASAYDATDAGTTDLATDTFNSLTTMGLLGLGIAVLSSYFLGGYAAGRIGLWHGAGHGATVVGWSVLFTILAVVLGTALGDQMSNVYVMPQIDWNAVTTGTIAGIAITLGLMLLGAILGGLLGARRDDADGEYAVRRRAGRARPL